MDRHVATEVAIPLNKRSEYNGDVRLFRVKPPMSTTIFTEDGNEVDKAIDYVLVSKADVRYSGPETYIFAADADGNVTNWCELRGSQRGVVSHEAALADAGYIVAVSK